MEYLVKDIEVLNDVVTIKLSNSNSNEVLYKIHIVAFTNYYLRRDTYISKIDLNNLLKESDYYFIKDKVISKLKIKDYSKYEIKEFIKDKLDESNLNRLILDLERNNYINDYNYVKRIFNEAESKLKGKLYIESRLNDKEIDESLIKAFLERFNEGMLANKLVYREYKKIENKYPKNTIINKISYKLNYNGFSEYIIKEEISKLEFIKYSDSFDLIEKDYLKLMKKYQNKYKDKELERKVIESLVLKGYNYKSVKDYVGGKKSD
jgi:SOS response regulatory protein OraA/RecX